MFLRKLSKPEKLKQKKHQNHSVIQNSSYLMKVNDKKFQISRQPQESSNAQPVRDGPHSNLSNKSIIHQLMNDVLFGTSSLRSCKNAAGMSRISDYNAAPLDGRPDENKGVQSCLQVRGKKDVISQGDESGSGSNPDKKQAKKTKAGQSCNDSKINVIESNVGQQQTKGQADAGKSQGPNVTVKMKITSSKASLTSETSKGNLPSLQNFDYQLSNLNQQQQSFKSSRFSCRESINQSEGISFRSHNSSQQDKLSNRTNKLLQKLTNKTKVKA